MTGALACACVCLMASVAHAAPTIRRVSVGAGGAQANGGSGEPSIDPTGWFIAFNSSASNLVGGDAGMDPDVFVWSRQTGQVTRRSFGEAGGEPNNGCFGSGVCAGATLVAFYSFATNIVPSDTNAATDVFMHSGSGTSRVSVGAGGQANGSSAGGVLDETGQRIAFQSFATNLVPDGGPVVLNSFVRDLLSGTTLRASETLGGGAVSSSCENTTIDPTGGWVAFDTLATDLVAGDTNGRKDIFVRDLDGGVTELVSVSTGGAQGNAESSQPSLAASADFVAFVSYATNLVGGDTNLRADIFVRARAAGVTSRVSVGAGGGEANGHSSRPRISADGRFVVFQSDATNLVAGDTNGWQDVFLHDRQTGVTTRVSVSASGAQGNSSSNTAAVSADGRFVTFASAASNLVAGDTNGQNDVFLVDLDPTPGDLTGDDVVNSADLSFLLGAWGPAPSAGDVDGDGDADASDLSALLGSWGPRQ